MSFLGWILTPLESGLLYTALGTFAGGSVVGLRVVRPSSNMKRLNLPRKDQPPCRKMCLPSFRV